MAVSLRFDILRHLALRSSYCNWYTFNQQLPIRLRFISVPFANISPSIATWAMKRNQLYIWADNQLFVNCVQLGLNCRVRQLRRAPSVEHSSQKVSRSNFVRVWMFAQSSFRNSANKWFCREDRLQSETNTLLTVFQNVNWLRRSRHGDGSYGQWLKFGNFSLSVAIGKKCYG